METQSLSHVLIVDDDEHIRELLTGWIETLETCGVLQAKDGEEGLEMARQHRPDVIVLDAVMPRLSGYDVCARLKEDPLLADIPVLILSVQNEIQDVVHGLDVGAQAYMTKPFKPQELLAHLRAMLRRKQRQDELKRQLSLCHRVFDTLPVGLALLDDQGRVQQWNQALETRTGWSQAQAQGQPANNLLRPEALNGGPEFAKLGPEGGRYQIHGPDAALRARVHRFHTEEGMSLVFLFE